MKKMPYLLCLIVMFNAPILQAQSTGDAGWKVLFDGKTLTGWRKATSNVPPGTAWSVQNNELSFDTGKGHGTDIITNQSFQDFDFTLQFKISEAGNSGIKFFLIPNTNLGCEFQIIDDSKHPDALLGVDGNRKTGSLYDIIPASKTKNYKPAGQWNTARVVSKGNHVEYWLNGGKVVEYDRGSESFKKGIAKSKFKTTKGFAEAKSSPILLQAHGDKVWFRDIKIKEL
ncbi:MAG: DUF1080 domain-containing protein [Chitinophagaceae bacterium]